MKLEISIADYKEKSYWFHKSGQAPDCYSDLQNQWQFSEHNGQTVEVFLSDEDGHRRQLAQLYYPDAQTLQKRLCEGGDLDLSYCYLDENNWPNEGWNALGTYSEFHSFKADHSVWNIKGNREVRLEKWKILFSNMSFQNSLFTHTKIVLDDIQVCNGNLLFSGSQFMDSNVSACFLECEGGKHSRPAISFHGCNAEQSSIKIQSCDNPMKLDLSGVQMKGCRVTIEDEDASDLEEITLDGSAIGDVCVSSAVVKHIYARQSDIARLSLQRCSITDSSLIQASVERFLCSGCILSGIMKLNLFGARDLGMDDTVIAGKLYMDNFQQVLPSILRHIDASEYNIASQLLTLKENFRQIGEYRNEDLCHLYYHRKATKRETKIWKRFFNNFFDLICGYGTKPFRLLILTVLTILIFALLFLIVPEIQFKGAETFIDYLYVSGVTFFTVGYGDVVPINDLTKIFIIIEAFFGVGMMSCLLALFSRKIIR